MGIFDVALELSQVDKKNVNVVVQLQFSTKPKEVDLGLVGSKGHIGGTVQTSNQGARILLYVRLASTPRQRKS